MCLQAPIKRPRKISEASFENSLSRSGSYDDLKPTCSGLSKSAPPTTGLLGNFEVFRFPFFIFDLSTHPSYESLLHRPPYFFLDILIIFYFHLGIRVKRENSSEWNVRGILPNTPLIYHNLYTVIFLMFLFVGF